MSSLQLTEDPDRVRSFGGDNSVYPAPKQSWFSTTKWAQKLLSVQLLQKTLEINTQSMDQLRHILYRHVPTVRISDTNSPVKWSPANFRTYRTQAISLWNDWK